jgi:hypothetical protein
MTYFHKTVERMVIFLLERLTKKYILNFDMLANADRIELRTKSDAPIKTITSPDTIEKVLAFARSHTEGWYTPWYGTPIPSIILNFYSASKSIGNFKIGGGFLECTQGVFWFRELERNDLDILMGILEYSEPYPLNLK